MTKGISNKVPAPSKQHFPFKKTMLALCIGAALQPTSHAQESQSIESDTLDGLEEVTVYGVRSALKSAQDIKRNADTHVDAISASDINALPDVSVLEALQRVPGVSIDRFSAPADADHFSTEGAGITLRGLPNTRSEFNGRDGFSANSSRGLTFQDVPAELLGNVKIFKNHTADQIEGGISGTVDLNTRKPFDNDDQVISIAAQLNYGDLERETTPSISGIFSDRWQVSGGEIGVLLNYSNSELDFRSDGIEFGRQNEVETEVGTRFVPVNAGIRTTSTNRDREGGALSIQYENTDNTFSVLGEYIRSDSSNSWLEHAFFSDDTGANGSGVQSGASFNSIGFQAGALNGLGDGFGPQLRRATTDSLVEDFSIKFGFKPNDRLSLSADFQYVQADLENQDQGIFGAFVQNGVQANVVEGGSRPSLTFSAPEGIGQTDAEFFADPNNYFFRSALDHQENSDGEEFAVRLDATYDLEFDFAQSVEVGVRVAERDQTTRWSTFNWGNLSETWRGGVSDFTGSTGGDGFSSTNVSSFTFDNFHGGGGSGIPGDSILFPADSIVDNAASFADEVFGFRNNGDLASRGNVAEGIFTPVEINNTVEENTAAYVRLNFGSAGENRLAGNVGLRYVKVDTQVQGGITFPNPINAELIPFLAADAVAFSNDFVVPEDAQNSFDTVLPSLNVKYEFSPDLIARFGLAKAVSFADLGNLRYNFNIDTVIESDSEDGEVVAASVERFVQNSGNPFLEPIEAINLDLSLEYYFADSSFVSVGLFYKDLENFVSNQTIETAVTNPSNGITQLVEINQPVNIGEASLSGVEFAYQQFFDGLPGVWSGLGMQFNFTYLNPSDVPNQNTRPVQAGNNDQAESALLPFDNLPLQGLSETQFNLVGIFQNKNVEARLAYNWRDDYLLSSRNVITRLPTFSEARGQLDGSVFYNVSDRWQVGLQGTNLTQSEIVNNSQVNQEGDQVFRTSFTFDRRFTFVVRGNF